MMTVTQVEGCAAASWEDSRPVAGNGGASLGKAEIPVAVSEARLTVILVGVGEETRQVNAPLTRQ